MRSKRTASTAILLALGGIAGLTAHFLSSPTSLPADGTGAATAVPGVLSEGGRAPVVARAPIPAIRPAFLSLVPAFSELSLTDAATTAVSPAAAPADGGQRRTIRVARGDTVFRLVADNSGSFADADAAVDALKTVYNPRRLQIGQRIDLLFRGVDGGSVFAGLALAADSDTTVLVERTAEGGFSARRAGAALPAETPGAAPEAAGLVVAALPAAPARLGGFALAEAGLSAPMPADSGLADSPSVGLGAELKAAIPGLAFTVLGLDAAKVGAVTDLPGVEIEASTPDVLLRQVAALRPAARPEALGGQGASDEQREVVEIEPGDTLLSILTGQSVPREVAFDAVEALKPAFDPHRLQVGQKVTLLFRPDADGRAFAGLELLPDIEDRLVLSRDDAGAFEVSTTENELETRLEARVGIVDTTLFAAAGDAGVPNQVLAGLIQAYSHAVDFQRDLSAGDSFEILYERDFHPDGAFARNGQIMYAALDIGGRRMPIYRFETEDGTSDFYRPDGVSIRRLLLRTPIDGARVSSGFGMRRHPILGYSRMHRGTDFAAGTGTPILAAGDGTIEFLGRNKGYGNYVRIRHNRGLSTAYGHMSRFAEGLHDGSHVDQGQVIGYVGSTGLATGPHLHYEVLVQGVQVNPMSVDLPTGRTLEGSELAAFQRMVADIDRRFATLRRGSELVAELPSR